MIYRQERFVKHIFLWAPTCSVDYLLGTQRTDNFYTTV